MRHQKILGVIVMASVCILTHCLGIVGALPDNFYGNEHVIAIEGVAEDGAPLVLEISHPYYNCIHLSLLKKLEDNDGKITVFEFTEYTVYETRFVSALSFPEFGVSLVFESTIGDAIDISFFIIRETINVVVQGTANGHKAIDSQDLYHTIKYDEGIAKMGIDEYLLTQGIGPISGTFLSTTLLARMVGLYLDQSITWGELKHVLFAYLGILPSVPPMQVCGTLMTEIVSVIAGVLITAPFKGWVAMLVGLVTGVGDVLLHHPELFEGPAVEEELIIPPGCKDMGWAWDCGTYVVPKARPWDRLYK